MMAKLDSALAGILARLDKLETSGAPSRSRSLVISRPVGISLPSEADRDGFEGSHAGHRLSYERVSAEDYLGSLKRPKAYGTRRQRLIGTDRIDVVALFQHMPEEYTDAQTTTIQVGDFSVEGTATRQGIPSRHRFARFVQARMSELSEDWARGEGAHEGGRAGRDFIEQETRVILARHQFLAAVDAHLSDELSPCLAWGAVWRYMAFLVGACWESRPLSEMGFNRDLLEYAMGARRDQLTVRQPPPQLLELAATSINGQWLEKAVAMDAGPGQREKGDGLNGATGGGDAKKPDRCSICHSQISECGGYAPPAWACTRDHVRGCTTKGCGLKHIHRGPRAWTCKQAAALAQAATGAERAEAFRMGFDDYVNKGKHRDALKANLK